MRGDAAYFAGFSVIEATTRKQTRDSLGVPHRPVQKLIGFDRDEVMAWARRGLQDAKYQGIDAKADRPGLPVPVVAAGSGIFASLISSMQCICIDYEMHMHYSLRTASQPETRYARHPASRINTDRPLSDHRA